MLLGEHHHACRVAQWMSRVALFAHFAHTVVNDQPSVPGQDGRSAGADLKPLPGRYGTGQPVMRDELTELIRRTVGNPDTFPVEIHVASPGTAGGFLRTGAGEKWPVQNGHFRMPGWIRNGDRKETGVFVVHAVEFNVLVWAKACKSQAPPVEKIFRYCQGDARGYGRICRVSHQVTLQWLYEGNARVFTAA